MTIVSPEMPKGDAVFVREKHRQPPITPLRDMMGGIGYNDTGEAGHGREITGWGGRV